MAGNSLLRAGQGAYARIKMRGWLNLPVWLEEFEHFKPQASLALLIASIAYWMICRPYDGIRHDGMFYTGQTMLHLGQENLRSDIFFSHGSQDQYSIFSSIYSVLVRIFGWSLASITAVAVMQVVFVSGVIFLLLEFAPLPLAALGLVMCGLHPYYGPFEIFSIGEPFTTARMFAEPVLIWTVWAALTHRLRLAIVLLAASAAMHPLLAAPIVILVAALAYMDHPAWRKAMLIGLAGLCVLVIAFAAVRPELFFTRYDDIWWDEIFEHTRQVSTTGWDFEGFSILIFDVGTLVLVARELEGRAAQFIALVALTVTGCFFVSCWTGSILRWQLFTEAQLWRAEDMGHLLALGLFPLLIWKKRRDGLLTLLGALFILIAMEFPRSQSVIPAVLGGLACLALSRRIPKATASFRWMIIAAGVFVMLAGTFNHFDQVAFDIRQAGDFGLKYYAHREFDSVFVAILSLLGLIAVAWAWPRIGLAFAMMMLIGAMSVWDHRIPFEMYLEAAMSEPPALDKLIPPTASVLWSDDLRLPWFILRRPSYLSRNQSAGLVFNRDTAMEFIEHSKVAEQFQSEIASCKEVNGMLDSCTLDATVMRDMCLPGAGGPGFVITDYPVSNLAPDFRWVIPGVRTGHQEWGVYSCASVVKRLPPEANEVHPVSPSHG